MMQNNAGPNAELIILDDEGDFIPGRIEAGNVTIISVEKRFRLLPAKYNALASFASRGSELLVVMEDDDIYFPNHCDNHWAQYIQGGELIYCGQVFDEKSEQCRMKLTRDDKNFHSGWSYSHEFFRKVGGYYLTDCLDFDQQTFERFRAAGACIRSTPEASHVYTWLSTGKANGSALINDDPDKNQWWERAAELPYDDKPESPIKLKPELTARARQLFEMNFPESLAMFDEMNAAGRFEY